MGIVMVVSRDSFVKTMLDLVFKDDLLIFCGIITCHPL